LVVWSAGFNRFAPLTRFRPSGKEAASFLRAWLKNVWLPRARPRPSSFILGFAGNFEDEDETQTEFSDTF
jgi:hypothetical protein